MAIKGELYVDYNGTLTKAHLTTEAELVEGLEDAMDASIGKATIRNTAANFASDDSIIEAGVIAYETDTNYFKIGDGETSYNNLEYANGRNGSLNGLIVEVMKDDGTYDEKGVDDVVLEIQD